MNGQGIDIDDRWLDAPLDRLEQYQLGEDPDEEADDPCLMEDWED